MSFFCDFCEITVESKWCPLCKRDKEGLTVDERNKKRPRKEVAGVHDVKEKRIKPKRDPFPNLVNRSSIRTSRNIFYWQQ